MKKAMINGIIKNSSVDGPGNRLVVFFQGCNINCLYCHNPETINFCNSCGLCIEKCPVSALELVDKTLVFKKDLCTNCDLCIKTCKRNSSPKTITYTSEELLKIIKIYKLFIRGITFSGGECTLHSDFILEIADKIKELALDIYIDTNGKWDAHKEKKLISNTNMFMLDVKAWDEEEHIKLTGFSNIDIKKNLDILIEKNKLFEVRTVVIPDFLDNHKTVSEVSKLIKGKSIRYKLIKYRNHGVREGIKLQSPSDEYMGDLKKLAKNIGVEDVIII